MGSQEMKNICFLTLVVVQIRATTVDKGEILCYLFGSAPLLTKFCSVLKHYIYIIFLNKLFNRLLFHAACCASLSLRYLSVFDTKYIIETTKNNQQLS
jgi:hypothetical protein